MAVTINNSQYYYDQTLPSKPDLSTTNISHKLKRLDYQNKTGFVDDDGTYVYFDQETDCTRDLSPYSGANKENIALIDAFDIEWRPFVINGTPITTTKSLLDYISALETRIGVLEGLHNIS